MYLDDRIFTYEGALFVIALFSLCVLSHLLLPATSTLGYVCDSKGQILSYRLNGVAVYLIVLLIYLLLPSSIQIIPYTYFPSIVFTCHVIGTATSCYFFFTNKTEKYSRCITRNDIDTNGKVTSEPPLAHQTGHRYSLSQFYIGREWNPRIWNVDVKILLYLIGAIQLQINIFGCSLYQLYSEGHFTYAIIVYNICFTWFIVEYLICENVHLYTYDFFAEKVGMKLSWGCLTFYPSFYCIGIFSIVHHENNKDISFETSILIISLFLCGWGITRGANMQKFYYRTNPLQKYVFYGLIEQKTLPNTRILVSGYWGVARHFNYFGEIVQSIALSLPGYMVGTGYLRFIPLLYPLYYLLLFIPRQIDDDAVCKQKYGKAWEEYIKRVPWRICPGIW